ncbi:hypothetical protein TorRG33x02_029280 [Trema orientale]|uniref:Uncharacterized protein n=1 Tax=Trema orientale TaxID=63057 RepID=A0A2P5FTR0_TREOI|nr:hypothetical protein TorRG33x02_029280 [Trema orientale]
MLVFLTIKSLFSFFTVKSLLSYLWFIYFCFTLIPFIFFYSKLLSISTCQKCAHLSRDKIRNKEKLLFKNKKRVKVIVFVQDRCKKLENFISFQYGSTLVQIFICAFYFA